jgi:hypothetical protein
VLAGGIALRLVQLLNGRPLWLDEAWLSLNILSRPFHGFFRPLDERQISPLGFLWLEWLVTRLGGAGEIALRTIPFAAGIVTLIGFSRLARRLLDPGAALFATALAALSPLLIYYSAEVKSYGLDAAAAVLLLNATLDMVEPNPSPRAPVRWALAGLVAALISTPAPFTVAGCALVVFVVLRSRRDTGALLRVAALGAPAALAFALQLGTLYHSSETTTFMHSYWAGSFLEPHVARAIAGVSLAVRELWLVMMFGMEAELHAPRKTATLLLGLSVVGLLSLLRRNRLHSALLVTPLLIAAAASLAQRWPLTPRLLLFAAPTVLLTLAGGVATVTRLAPMRLRTLVFAASAIVVTLATSLMAVSELEHPSLVDPMPDAMAYVGTGQGKDATVYVSAYFVPACTYYSQWHPNHLPGVGKSSARECALPGSRMVLGTWPDLDVGSAALTPDARRSAMAAWVTSESARLLGITTSELWLIVPGKLADFGTLRPALEGAGAIPVAERQWSRLAVYHYRVPPNPSREQPGLR